MTWLCHTALAFMPAMTDIRHGSRQKNVFKRFLGTFFEDSMRKLDDHVVHGKKNEKHAISTIQMRRQPTRKKAIKNRRFSAHYLITSTSK